ncbi:MAG TPA: hypothetical protein VLH79_12415 [Chthonomonadales bacterium]|nr:hypothetical protein [Chthonomonadales bacterium]
MAAAGTGPEVARDARTETLEDLRAYARRLHSYTSDEIEDIYFRIHILEQPLRYRLVQMEMERRGLRVADPDAVRLDLDLAAWLCSRRQLRDRAWLREPLIALGVTLATAVATAGMLLPIWACAMPIGFLGLQPAMVYLACTPVPLIVGAGIGARLGGRRWRSAWTFSGVAAAAWAFYLTGAPEQIVLSALTDRPSGGAGFGAF